MEDKLLNVKENSSYIYVLKLGSGKYYVGKSSNVIKRIEEHKSGNSGVWVDRFKFESILEIEEEKDIYHENNKTLEMIEKHGIDNVRGGFMITIGITEMHKKIVNSLLCSIHNKCFNCNEEGHFARDCMKPKVYYV